MTAIIFPGQGSQYVNMSMDFNENFDVAKEDFEVPFSEILIESPKDIFEKALSEI